MEPDRQLVTCRDLGHVDHRRPLSVGDDGEPALEHTEGRQRIQFAGGPSESEPRIREATPGGLLQARLESLEATPIPGELGPWMLPLQALT